MSLGPRGIAWVGGLFIAVVAGLAAYDIYRGYEATVSDTGRELDTQARIIAEQTARSLQAVDVVLRNFEEQSRKGVLEGMSERDLHASLREHAIGLVQVQGLLVIEPSGVTRASSLVYPLPEVKQSVASLPAFKTLQASRDSGLMVGTVLQSEVDRAWVLPIGRRIETPRGDFAGAIGARGKIDYFQEFYRDLQLEAGTTIALMHMNGTLVARHPPAEASLGKRLPLFDDLLARHAAAAGPIRSVSPVDGVERFGALQLVPEYPLAVVVTREVATALAPWHAQSLRAALRTLGLGALAAILLVLLMRQFSRLYRTRESLEASRERFALAVAGSDDGIWDYDFRTGRVFASPRARELSGRPPGPETQPIDDWLNSVAIHPDDAPLRLAAREGHLSGKLPAYEGEWRMRRADGSYRWVRLHGLCIRDASGKPYRMAGSISDIDARKRAEEALRASEERFALAVAGSNDGIIDWDIVNDRLYSSKRAMEILDIDSDVTVRTLDEWRRAVNYHPDDRRTLRDDLDAFFASRSELGDVEYRVVLRDGRIRWIRHRHICVRDAAGKALRLVGSVSDVDAQKRAEEALRASEEQYRAIFNAAADAFVLRDEERVVDVNPAFEQITGYTREEVLNRSDWCFAVPAMGELSREMHRRTIAGETVHFETRARRKDGELIDVEIRAVPIRYRGRPHALGMARDITARKRAEAERLRLEGQLLQAKKLEAIGTLAGGIAHDFNNILSATLGYGEMAQKEAPPGTALRRHIDAVVSAGLRAKSLVERILAFSRSGIGERAPVRVQAVVTEALDLLAASLPQHVRLERELAAADAAVMGDPTQIHQVVMNLCANGAQAMKSPGTLKVKLEVVEKRDSMAATSALSGGRYVRLRVRDTGSGIPPKLLERIFDPFFTTKDVGVGTGLGLSLVHGIVTDLGGGIDVESELGKGSAFTVYLPLSDAVAAAPSNEEPIVHGDGETVLIVDDEEPLVRLSEEMIAGLGYEPVGFTSSSAALEAFRADPQRFQAVLSDEAMPEMTGSELAKEMRTLRADIPIIFMSGFVTTALSARARGLGVAEVLGKPLVERDIARALGAALRDARKELV